MGMINAQMGPEQEDLQEPNHPPEGTPQDQSQDLSEGEPLDPQDLAADITPEQDQMAERFSLAVDKVLYDDGMAKDVALRLKEADDPVSTMSDVSYEIVTTVDERTGGMVEDELIAAVAFDVLGKVAEIGQQAGLKINGEQMAGAAQEMITRYLKENGATEQEIATLTQGVDLAGAGQQIDGEMAAPDEMTGA